jgi:hypothetical protein
MKLKIPKQLKGKNIWYAFIPIILLLVVVNYAVTSNELVHFSINYSPEPVFASPISDFKAQASISAIKRPGVWWRSADIQATGSTSVNPRMVAFMNYVMSKFNVTITANLTILDSTSKTVFDKTITIRQYSDMKMDVDVDRASLGDTCRVILKLTFNINYTDPATQHPIIYEKTVTRTRVVNLTLPEDSGAMTEYILPTP